MSNNFGSDANNNTQGIAHPFGKVLAKGTRLDLATELFTGLLFAGLLAGGIMIGAGFLANHVKEQNTVRMPGFGGMSGPALSFGDDKANAVIFGGIVGASVLVIFTLLFSVRACQTEITVYENGISGTGAGKSFNYDFALHSFQLTWDKITSVDASGTAATGKTVIVHAAGAQYKCYVKNSSEIQGIILNQQRKIAGAT